MLLTRTITLIIFGGFILVAIYLAPLWLFHGLTAAIFLLAAYEWSALLPHSTRLMRAFFVAAVLLVFISCYHYYPQLGLFIGVIWWLLSPVYLKCFASNRQKAWMQNHGVACLMAFYSLVPAWLAVTLLRTESTHPRLLLLLLFSVWIADISAYIAGKLWGKRKLAPKISPGKTLEGVAGASAIILLWSITTHYYFHYQVPWIVWLVLLSVTLYLSIIGDLFESVLKRQKGVKDSGTILPGHGGILDRIDALLAAAPFFYLAVSWLGLK